MRSYAYKRQITCEVPQPPRTRHFIRWHDGRVLRQQSMQLRL